MFKLSRSLHLTDMSAASAEYPLNVGGGMKALMGVWRGDVMRGSLLHAEDTSGRESDTVFAQRMKGTTMNGGNMDALQGGELLEVWRR